MKRIEGQMLYWLESIDVLLTLKTPKGDVLRRFLSLLTVAVTGVALLALPEVASSAAPEDASHSQDHVLVKLAPGAKPGAILGQSSSAVFDRWHVQPVPIGKTPEDVLDRLRTERGVERVELDYVVRVEPSGASDPRAASQNANDPLMPFQWHLPAVQTQSAWQESTGQGVVVAVVDSGISQDGEDLDCQTLIAPYNAITPPTQGSDAAKDDFGHGTHVAGTVAQCTDNGIGVAGIAPGADLMPVKVLDSTGFGLMSSVARGVDWARTHGADVINLSLGCSSCPSAMMDDAIDAAVDEGVVIVAASGNSNSSSVFYPASHPKVIAVGATGVDNERAPYSNRGTALDLVAPGGNTDQDLNGDGYADGVLQETFTADFGWGYYFFQGTSMATPHVSAAAAILKSLAPGLDPESLKSILETTAMDLGPAGFDNEYGHGLIQIADAIEYLSTPDLTPPIWAPGAELGVELVGDGSVLLSWPKAEDDRGIGSYRVYTDGNLSATTTKTTYTVGGMESATGYGFEIRAVDQAGNLSTSLSASFVTPDWAAPIWHETARVTVAGYGEQQLTLNWGGAHDDVGVTGYRVGSIGTSGIRAEGTRATLTGLEPGNSYLIEVHARDATGNWSDPLQATVRTARRFFDTPGTTFYDDILWMSGMDITRGCNPPDNDLFCPDDPVTRGQFAAFTVRALGLKANEHPSFRDVADGSTFADDIGRLATAGITRGCNPPDNDLFCPDDPLTRAQMAAFVVRMLGLTANSNPDFVDVPKSSTFATDIGRLATAGITRGCNPPANDLFCPDDSVTRGQLAAFLERALG